MITKKNLTRFAIVAITMLFGLNSCVVKKPIMNNVSEKDYNSRREVNGARYKKRPSTAGIILTAAAPVAGAVVGYNTNFIVVQKDAINQPVKPANAAIGAVLGYTVANLMNYTFGLNKIYPADDPARWIKSVNDSYAYIPGTKTDDKFTIVKKSAESTFKARNLNDFKQFYALFPSSSHRNEVFRQAVESCSRDEMLELIAMDAGNTYANEAKRKYILESNSYEDLAAAQKKFPGVNGDFEALYASKVVNIANALDFKNRYPSSKLNKKVIWNAFSTGDQALNNIQSMKSRFGSDFQMTSADLKEQPTEAQRRNYLRALYQVSNVRDASSLESFYINNEWVKYAEKASDIVTNLYSTAYNSFDDGNYLIYYMNQLPNDDVYKKWGVTSSIVKSTIDTQLKGEEEKIKVASTHSLGQDHSDWQKWLNNTTYTAGLVAENTEMKYIIYGEIENTSKFDMPVVINASGDLVAEAQLKGKGGVLGQIFGALFQAASGGPKVVSSASNQFIIPSLPAKSKSSYAVLLTFKGGGNSGVNVGDWFKIARESHLGNLQVTRTVESKPLTYSAETVQEQWLDMAHNGMPDVILTDLNRHERVDNDVWAQRWQVERQRRVEAEARYEAEERAKKSINEAVEKELSNRKADVKFSKTYKVNYGNDQATEYTVTFGDRTCGSIGVVNNHWYYHKSVFPGGAPGGFNDWRGPFDSEQGAINALYEALH